MYHQDRQRNVLVQVVRLPVAFREAVRGGRSGLVSLGHGPDAEIYSMPRRRSRSPVTAWCEKTQEEDSQPPPLMLRPALLH